MKIQDTPKVVVGAIILNDKDEIFLARSKKWKDRWVVPGGHLKFGETLEQAVRREIKEETFLEVSDIKLIDVKESIFSEEYHKRKHLVFIDFSCKAQSSRIMLNDELQEYIWTEPDKALQMDLNIFTRELVEKYIDIQKSKDNGLI
ncbi:MAG: NUDIX domain-containing protein [Candidatus Aenigmarchaeota archaeon]|nr:NUDIX domain-containing protein [Candidatus Aenigmarchaeota archaeon]MCK5451837.1 NUDIX domain-containing protein [Candidatus Aenigmarchaeota archaeon]